MSELTALAPARAERDWRRGGSYECNPYPTGSEAWFEYQRRIRELDDEHHQREQEQIHGGL